MQQQNKKALIIVDLQNDFCTGGSLAVPNGDEVMPLANLLQEKFDLVIATKDWHPKDHTSFASQHPGYAVGEVIEIEGIPQVLWPDHCVQGTKGSDYHPALETYHIDHEIFKGTDKKIDSYSAFFDNAHLRATGLAQYLAEHEIKDIYIMGLATDYCVKYSCFDAIYLGFNTFVIADACRGVNLKPNDSQIALEEMEKRGAKMIKVQDLLTV